MYRRALSAAPLDPVAHYQLAVFFLAQGRVEDALVQCRQLAALENPPPSTWVLFAQAQFRRNLSLPKESRDWGEVERLLKKATETGRHGIEVTLLRAEVLAAQAMHGVV